MDINYLLFLQQLRELSGGILNTFMLALTSLGEAAVTWGLLAAVYWCIDKRAGQLMALNVSFACTLNQAVKRICKIERPWIQDSRIQPVEAALTKATGYSFPSGHTTRVTATWGALSRVLWKKRETCLSVMCGVVCLIVAFSRNYLGVHTAKDVLAAFVTGVMLIVVLDNVLDWAERGKYRDLLVGTAGCIVFLLFMLRVGCLSNAGAGVGLLFGWIVERRYIQFKVDGSFREKAFRFLVGGSFLLFLYTVPGVILGYFMEAKYASFFAQFLFTFMLMAGYPFLFFRLKGDDKAEKKLGMLIIAWIMGMTIGGFVLYHGFASADENSGGSVAAPGQEMSVESGVAQSDSADAAVSDQVKVIAHRGYSSQFPENTLAAFRGACELGVDYIETDVQCTKDGVLVLFHDTDLSRITGAEGNVIDYTYDELCQLDAGCWFGEAFMGERIPTLEETLDYLKGEDCSLYLELKDIGEAEGFEEKVVETVREYGMMDRCVFASFNYEYLCAIKEADHSAKILYNTSSGKASVVNDYPAEYYGLYLENVSADLIEAIHEAGSRAFVWTVDTPQAMKNVIALGADGMVTNRPGVAKIAVCPEYDFLVQNYEGSFALPGLYEKNLPEGCGDVVVQGLAKTPQNLIISAYSKTGADSILYVMDLSGKLVNVVNLGFAAHTGGISYDAANDFLWVTGPDGLVYAISGSEVINGTYSGNILVSFDAGLVNHNQAKVASFLTYFENQLFVGSWVDGANGVMNRYDLTEPGSPELEASMILPDRIQGVTFWRDYGSGMTQMYLSQSSQTLDGALLCFEYTEECMDYTQPLMSYVLPEGSEQVQATARGIYILFESAALPYRSTARVRNDQVYLIRLPEW